MASFTATGTGGNLSAGSSWVGGVAPGNGTGDVIVVPSGSTIVVDQNWTLGATTGTPGHAFTLNGASSGSFGTLQVANGVALTLCGVDTASNTLGLISQFGLFQPLTGSTVLGNVAADYASVVLNKGRFEPQTGVAFSIPAANVPSWAVFVSSQSGAPSAYRDDLKLVSLATTAPQIANGTQTGLGAFGNWPATGITAGVGQGFYTPSGWNSGENPATEVSLAFPATAAQIAAVVNAPGKYAVDYDQGAVYFYSSTNTGLTIHYNYYHLDKTSANWRGWGIVSLGNSTSAQVGSPAPTTGNTFLFDGCSCQYMGASTSTIKTIPSNGWSCQAPIVLINHYTATASYNSQTGSATTVGRVRNSTFNQCSKWVQLFQCIGASADPVLVTGNTFNDCSGSSFIDGINFYASFSRYVKIDSNQFRHRGTAIDLINIGADVANLSVTNNTGTVGFSFINGGSSSGAGARTPFPFLNDPDASFAVPNTLTGNRPTTPDLYVGGNTINGLGENGLVVDSRFLCVSGASGHTAIVELNSFTCCHRLGNNVGSYVTFRRNLFGWSYHHGFTGSVIDDQYSTDLRWENNLFFNDRSAGTESCAAVQIGYNHRCFVNNLQVCNNTFDGWVAGVDFGDVIDTGPTLETNVVVNNNVIANGRYAFTTYHSATIPWNPHILECDYNVTYNQGTSYGQGGANGLINTTNPTSPFVGTSKYNRLTTGNRNIPSVALFDGSYTTAQASCALGYTVNTLGQDHTLKWSTNGGSTYGTAQQLIYDHGTSAGQGLRTLACSSTVNVWNNANVAIRQQWLWVISGTGAGQAREVSFASANVCYSASVNAGGTSYSVGQYIKVSGGTTDSPGAAVILKVTSVSGGVVTGLQVVSGGTYTTTPGTTAVATTRITGNTGASLTVNLSWAPGVLLSPDLTTALDSTSVFAIVNAMVTLPDQASGTIKAGIGMCDYPSPLGTITLPTTSQTDTGIAIAVNHSPTTSPGWLGTFPGSVPTGVPTDYQTARTGSGVDAGTSDNAASTDYFGSTRPSGAAYDIGFFEYLLSIGVYPAQVPPSTGGIGLLFTGVGTNWVNGPNITASAGTLVAPAQINTGLSWSNYTSPASGTVTFTDSTDSGIQCTLTVVQTFTCAPVIAPTSATLASVQLIFTSVGGGLSGASTITANGSVSGNLSGSLGALTAIGSNSVSATFTLPAAAQVVTFTFGLVTCTLNVVATNPYTYELSEIQQALNGSSIMYGRWTKNSQPIEGWGWLMFSLSAPFSAVTLTGMNNTGANCYGASSTGNINNLQLQGCTGNATSVPVFSNTTEAQYNLYLMPGSSVGWGTAQSGANSKAAMTVYSTAASKPTITAYVDTCDDGATYTMPAPAYPFNSNDTETFAGSSGVSPPLLSGNWNAYGFQDFIPTGSMFPDSNGICPPLGQNGYGSPLGASSNSKARFNATAGAIYINQFGLHQLYGSRSNPQSVAPAPTHLEIDGQSFGADRNLNFISNPYTGFPSNQPILCRVAHNLSLSAIHEYSVYPGPATQVDRVIVAGAGSSFAKTPVKPRLSVLVGGDSHTQGYICWESNGHQAGSWPYILARLAGVDVYNLGVSSNKIADQSLHLGPNLVSLPVLSNGVIAPQTGSGCTVTFTLSGGSTGGISTCTVTNGGSGYPGTIVRIQPFNASGQPFGAVVTCPVVNGVVIGTPTVWIPGSGYTLSTIQYTVGPPCGLPDVLIMNIGFNDWITTSNTTCRTNYQTILNWWLQNATGPVVVVYTYGNQGGALPGHDIPQPTISTFTNYDIFFAIQQVIAANPAYASRIFTTDQGSFSIQNCGSQASSITSTSSGAPGYFFAGGHMCTSGYTSLAQAILPDLRRALASINGGIR